MFQIRSQCFLSALLIIFIPPKWILSPVLGDVSLCHHKNSDTSQSEHRLSKQDAANEPLKSYKMDQWAISFRGKCPLLTFASLLACKVVFTMPSKQKLKTLSFVSSSLQNLLMMFTRAHESSCHETEVRLSLLNVV